MSTFDLSTEELSCLYKCVSYCQRIFDMQLNDDERLFKDFQCQQFADILNNVYAKVCDEYLDSCRTLANKD